VFKLHRRGVFEAFSRRDDGLWRHVEKMVWNHMPQFPEPEIRHRSQHAPLPGYRGRQDDVEGGKPVSLNDQHALRIDFVQIAHFSAMQELQRRKIGFVQWLVRVHFIVPQTDFRIVRAVSLP
jgi:hypothetical protein